MILTCEIMPITKETRHKIKTACKKLWSDCTNVDIVGYEKYPSGINVFYVSVLTFNGLTTHSYNKWIAV